MMTMIMVTKEEKLKELLNELTIIHTHSLSRKSFNDLNSKVNLGKK